MRSYIYKFTNHSIHLSKISCIITAIRGANHLPVLVNDMKSHAFALVFHGPAYLYNIFFN